MKSNVIAKISRIKERAEKFLLSELESAGCGEMSPSHGDILAVLFASDGIKMQETAKKIHRTKATTTVLIDKLEKSGFVKRVKSSQDSRCTNVILTPKGTAFKPVFEQISEKLNNTAFYGFTGGEKAMLEELLEKMRKNFK